MHTNQFRIHIARRITTRQRQYTEAPCFLFIAYYLCYFTSDVIGTFFYRFINIGRDFFKSGQYRPFKCILRSVGGITVLGPGAAVADDYVLPANRMRSVDGKETVR